MKKVIPILLIVILIVTVLFPSFSNLELGNKIVGEDSWIAEQIRTIEPLAKAVEFCANLTRDIIVAIGTVVDRVVEFFKNPWDVIFNTGG